ncbi:class I tRNA ligase family protein [Candidatus Parcubacteria bacterium]|nr:class I tRNA ligase family protein [Patescibacteria group bacterium]MBU4308999.1 class I tRNA ligase family protein [Patescibacteria group bacterium]MBU4432407.1 class I tRNA ligase family protein [Patescibacteria group bacterium]MBU4577359.1 class I tRNA ligase family protein [Patescibacteria group bacterium]MCG2697047.1 class I tRNA ligase family protein [Candidatus Parcubacteria bacterium]
MKNKFYITTPIYYVNAQPHIGHTYTTVAADVLARHHRLIGDEVFFLTGTDEHGAKIQQKADVAGKDPKFFVDEIVASYHKAWKELSISNDKFIRTTDENHKLAVQNALQKMYDKGDIYLDKYEGLYCTGCEQFKNEKDLVGGLCPDHNTEPEKMCEDTYVFKMSKYSDRLLQKIKSDEYKIIPVERKHEIVNFYEKEGLNDISFSRKNVKWGIPLPWDTSHTAYVWSDAFLNYLTGLGWDGVDGAPDMFPPEVQLMSKDILRVHTTIWPAMLLSLDMPLPKQLFVHGFFLVDGQKMSKSIGNVIGPSELIAKYGVDASRYLIMSSIAMGRDGDIGWEKFDDKFNADLANGLGNLVARVSNMLEKGEVEVAIVANSDQELIDKFNVNIDNFLFNETLLLLWDKVRESDEYISKTTPWKIKEKDELKKVLEPVAQNILNIAELLQPFMPETASKIIAQFSEKQIKKGEALFPRL